ncbi:oxalate:formate antiporter [Elysia marginata]|uniref:Oxalate:formate antiporter n=1 Tax=Elysia marginata TaxID=1093978 RepID=A0AAV4JR63_9GAST|nr:oxalate:formate antiporter [Elysia marginata]
MLRCLNTGKCMKFRSIVGAHFVMAPLSFLWVYGNLSAYTDSYFRFACSPACMDGDSQWTLCLLVAMICPGILITKKFADKIGLKLFGVVSVVVVNAAMFASAWVIDMSVVGTSLLLGFVNGLAQGVSSTIAFQYVSGWAPHKTPLFMATVSGASTFMSVVQNPIITAIVNPDNIKPDAIIGSRTFFSQPEVLARVPVALKALAATNLGLQVIGYLLLAPQPGPGEASENLEKSHKLDHRSRVGRNLREHEPSFKKSLKDLENQRNGDGCESYGSSDVTGPTVAQESGDKVSPHSALNRDGGSHTNSTQTEGEHRSLKPREALKRPVFYALFMFGAATMYTLVLKSNYYKQFGLLYIHNDRYLTLVGTLIPIVASVSRFVFGLILNRNIITIKDSIVFSLAINSVLCAIWYLVPQINDVLYLFFTLCLAVVQSLNYIILPLASLQIFGPAHFSTNYGLVQSCLFFVGMLGPLVISLLMKTFGWLWLFGSASFFCLLSLLLVVCADFNTLKP